MSTFGKLSSKEFWEGLVLAITGAVLAVIQQFLTVGTLNPTLWNWDTILTVALSAGLAYLSRNLFTTQDGKLLGVARVGDRK